MIIKEVKSGGILLPQFDIGLDCRSAAAGHLFISHAHSDHTPRRSNQPVYCTKNTFKLMQKRGCDNEARTPDFGETVKLPNAQVTLYPAGHILGSAMIYVETEEGSVLYTGDYRTPPSPATEGFDYPNHVDILITEATFGLPIYKWQSYEKLAELVHHFARETLNSANTPVFLAYDLGKAQELLYLLAPARLRVQVSGKCYELCEVYEKAGINLGNYEHHNSQSFQNKAVIAALSGRRNGFISEISKKRLAYCSGWATHDSPHWGPKDVDVRIPISDHLDFFELIDFCKALTPEKVIITHTPDASVVQHYLDQLNIQSIVL
jgi:putative mRNA 3-end processing factor